MAFHIIVGGIGEVIREVARLWPMSRIKSSVRVYYGIAANPNPFSPHNHCRYISISSVESAAIINTVFVTQVISHRSARLIRKSLPLPRETLPELISRLSRLSLDHLNG